MYQTSTYNALCNTGESIHKVSLTNNSLNMFKYKINININLYWVDPCPGFLGLVDFSLLFYVQESPFVLFLTPID